jgi:hypothetical protein
VTYGPTVYELVVFPCIGESGLAGGVSTISTELDGPQSDVKGRDEPDEPPTPLVKP